jgi:hypothetical protein
MTPTERERLDRIWDSLSEGESDDAPALTALELNLRSVAALATAFTEESAQGWDAVVGIEVPTRARLRFSGSSVAGNNAPVRLAARVLTTLQELVTAIAMSARGRKSLFGAPPADIRLATELSLFPLPSLGSVIFELAGPERPDCVNQLPGLGEETNAADRAAISLRQVLDEAMVDDKTALTQDLKQLGPRVASHLRNLALFPIDNDLTLDLEWRQSNGERISGQLGRREATVLQEVITLSRASVETQTLDGVLVTISVEEPLALRLLTGERVPMSLRSDLEVGQVADYFNKRVRARVEVAVTAHPTTGRDVREYTLVEVQAVTDY